MTMRPSTYVACGLCAGLLVAVAANTAAQSDGLNGILEQPLSGTIDADLDLGSNLLTGSALMQYGAACTSGHSLGATDGCFAADVEFNGVVYTDSTVDRAHNTTHYLGGTNPANGGTHNNQSLAQFVFGLGSTYGRHWVFAEWAYRFDDFDHAAQTNPTIYVHSATDPDSDNTEWVSMAHDQTNAVLSSGKGAVAVSAAGLKPASVTADPCAGGTYPEGSIFWNDTSDYLCYCDAGGVDLKVNDNTTACF